MKDEKIKICPFISTPDDRVKCIGEKCMAWGDVVKYYICSNGTETTAIYEKGCQLIKRTNE